MTRLPWLGCALLLLAAGAHANPLRDLQSARGGVVVTHERATGADAEFDRLAAQPAPVFRVEVSGDAQQVAPQVATRVAADYFEGLLQVLPRAAEAETAAAAQYLVQLQLARGDRMVEGSEQVYANRQAGTVCKVLPDGSVSCGDVGSAPMAVGKRTTEKAEHTVEVVVRLYRLGEDGEDGARTVVFEDAYGLSYYGEDCRNDIAAAGTIATALGRNALSKQPLNMRMYSTPRILRCDSK
jgi:hypothetical protein